MAVGSYIRKLGISNTASAHYIVDDWMKLYAQANSNASTVWRETLEGANFGGFGGKSSNRQFLNHQCFSYILSAFKY